MAALINSSTVLHLRKDLEKVGMNQVKICGRAFQQKGERVQEPHENWKQDKYNQDSKKIVCLEQREEERGRWGEA